MTRFGSLLRVARAEGWGGTVARARDRLAERAWRSTFVQRSDRLDAEVGAWPVLLVGSAPPAARFGGVQAQLASRLVAAADPWALLHPEPGGYRLAATSGERRSALRRAAPPLVPGALDDAPFAAAVEWALAQTGAGAVQIEGAADLPLRTVLAVARHVPLVLAVHDFTLFCVRAHLFALPDDRFCGWCRDAERCRRCLRADGAGFDVEYLAERREVAAALLEAARAVIFPSNFVRDRYAELFPSRPSAVRAVIAPAAPVGPFPRWWPRADGERGCVAFAGTALGHKGAAVFEGLVAALRAVPSPPRFSAYGGGDPTILNRWRRLGIAVHGYYGAGTLPARLARDGVDVVVLPSVVPESYGLILSECRRAGVPVVAFDFGAIADRVRAHGDGRLVPIAEGAAGLARAVADVLCARRATPKRAVATRADDDGGAEVRRAVAEWAALHRALGLDGAQPA